MSVQLLSPGSRVGGAGPLSKPSRATAPSRGNASFLAPESLSALKHQASSRASVAPARALRQETAMKSTGKFIVGGNWKCNGSSESIKQLVADLNAGAAGITKNVEVFCAPPYLYLSQVKDTLAPPFETAAQNCWISTGGAYTGEVSADMIKDAQIPWVITGHSERRALCGETNEIVAEKTAYALSLGLKVTVCIGETLEQRQKGETLDVCFAQLQAVVDVVKDWSNVVIAYEPVWAIGTGVVATPEQAQEVHAGLREWLTDKVGPFVAQSIRIQYGGSVNPGNCDELARQEDIDGFLVGGASLQAESFITICNSAV